MTSVAAATPGRGADLALVGRQIVAEQKTFWRNPLSAGFTFVFPLMFLVIFSSLQTGTRIKELGNIRYTEYYVPGIVAFSIISACFTNLSINLVNRRDTGILKRLRGTPLPAWGLLAGLLASEAIVSVILSILTLGLGMVAYGNAAPRHVVWLILALVLGAATFCALGVAVTVIIPNADSAPAIVNFLVFPLLFLSGTFFPVDNQVLNHISDLFPIRSFQQALFQATDPIHTASRPAIRYLLTMLGWLVAGAVVAITKFRWEKQPE